jgi:hypothetical protein
LVPGTGRLEIVEIDWEPCCDDESLSTDDNAPFNVWWRTICHASQRIGRSIEYPHHLPRALEQIGFEIEVNEVIRVQSYEKLQKHHSPRTTAADAKASDIARWYITSMGPSPDAQTGKILRSFSGMSMELFTSVEGWTAQQVENLQDGMHHEMIRSSVHLYHRL